MKYITINDIGFFVDESSHPSHWQHVNSGIWEPYTYKIFDKFLSKDKTYIDIGAWIGSTVLYGAQLSKHVFAVEPDEVALNILYNNINLNEELVNKITVFDGCLCDVDGFVKLGAKVLGDSTSSIVGASNSKNTIEVKSMKFGSFIENYSITDCNFVKMDVEGAEIVLIPSMYEYLNLNKPVLYVSFHPWVFKENIKKEMEKVLNIYNSFYDAHNMNRIQLSDIFKYRGIVCE